MKTSPDRADGQNHRIDYASKISFLAATAIVTLCLGTSMASIGIATLAYTEKGCGLPSSVPSGILVDCFNPDGSVKGILMRRSLDKIGVFATVFEHGTATSYDIGLP